MENRPSSIDDIYLAALERSSAQERIALLESACAGKPELRRRVERLLEVQGHLGSFLEAPAPEICPTASSPATEKPGTQIGPYKLLQQIGEGGMGVVYLAEQLEPVKRRVALKIIKPGMDSRQVIARFEAERQALSLMDHPNIAKVFDAGTTRGSEPGGVSPGSPYFVMELVHGQPITQYCDERHLTPRQRLQLLLPVCQAIQHAHQKGIIHRDIKPTNILVAEYDEKPVPKVIDFGVAKATSQSLTEKTMFTGLGQIVGTLEYMSPEQAGINQLDIDTRSDIYSLGVLLYELLTGSTPFTRKELEKAGMLEMLRVIREQEPSKPSTKLSTADGLPSLAANRGTEPAKLAKLVRGELDWIVMKALEKDRNRRYESANGFAMDLERYLADEQVQACPPSVGYRLRKLVRRNKVALATTALLALMLLAAVGGVAGAIGWAARNRTALEQQVAQDRATRQAVLVEEVGRALDDAAASYQRDKLSEAQAEVKRAQGLLAGGEADAELLQRVQNWRTDLDFAVRLEGIPLERVVVDRNQVVVDQNQLDWAASDTAYQKAFREYRLDLATLTPQDVADRIRPSVIRDRLIAALDDWWLCRRFARHDGKDQLLEVVQGADGDPLRAGFRAAFKRKDRRELARLAVDPDLATQQPATVCLLASMLHTMGQAADAVKLLEKAQQRHPSDFWINYNLANYLTRLEPPREADAVGYYRVAVSQRPDNGMVHNALGYALRRDKKPAQAEAAFREALLFWPNSAVIQTNLGILMTDQRRWEEARIALERAVGLKPDYLWPRNNLAWIYANCPDPRFHDLPRALEHAHKATELAPNSRLRWNHLGAIQYRAGMWQQALETLQKAAHTEAAPDNYHCIYLALANWRLGNKSEALEHWVQFVPWMDSTASSRIPLHQEELRSLRAEAEGLLGEYSDLETAYREIVRLDPKSAVAYYRLADTYFRSGEWSKSAAAYLKALNQQDPNDLDTWLRCACTLVQTGETEAYHQLCERMLKRFGKSGDVHCVAILAHVCVLAPNALADSARVLQLAEQRRSLTADVEIHRLWSLHVLGLAYYRAGQYEKAVVQLEAGRTDPALPAELELSNRLALAMARHQLGQEDEAAIALDSAKSAQFEPGQGNVMGLIQRILLREAETLSANKRELNHKNKTGR